jgi:hypothetical protein
MSEADAAALEGSAGRGRAPTRTRASSHLSDRAHGLAGPQSTQSPGWTYRERALS